MFFKRPQPLDVLVAPTLADPVQSTRRQGAFEALNLMARSVADAAAAARSEALAGQPDNFLAGQFMALGHVMVCIERERDLLHQQLMQEAGLHLSSVGSAWDNELALLDPLPIASEDLFRLAMDYRKLDEPAPLAAEGAEPAPDRADETAISGSESEEDPSAVGSASDAESPTAPASPELAAPANSAG